MATLLGKIFVWPWGDFLMLDNFKTFFLCVSYYMQILLGLIKWFMTLTNKVNITIAILVPLLILCVWDCQNMMTVNCMATIMHRQKGEKKNQMWGSKNSPGQFLPLSSWTSNCFSTSKLNLKVFYPFCLRHCEMEIIFMKIPSLMWNSAFK